MLKIKLISFLYVNFIKKIFFKFDPELVHDRMLVFGEVLGRFLCFRLLTKVVFYFEDRRLEQVVSGITFKNPVGLSAGFDKNAKLLKILPNVGFAHAEFGSVTYGAYEGNPKPRLYRLPKSKALTVYYGLKNEGVKPILNRIQENFSPKGDFIIGLSVARTNSDDTAELNAGILDYTKCVKEVVDSGLANYITINISCPNTFGGEPFTTPSRLERLLSSIAKVKTSIPLFVKMPIDLPWEEFDKLLEIIIKYKFDGAVIGNLTKNRQSKLIKDLIPEEIKGGISGLPTQHLSDELIRRTYLKYGNKLVIVGVGGIFSAEDAYRKIKFGASLVQLITGMIYEGPQLIGSINRGLRDLLIADGFSNVSEAIGIDSRKKSTVTIKR